MESTNWLAIIVAAIATVVIGFIWYNPKTFGSAWMKSVNMTEEDAKKGNMPLIMILSLLLAGVIAYRLNRGAVHHGPDDQNFLHGAFHAVQTSGFYVLPVIISSMIFAQRNIQGILIDVGYWLASFAVMGGILYTWQGMAG